jgi:uncharacterized protein (TIGR01244 family)
MGVNIPNAREYQGVLTGGQPSDDQYREAKEAGFTTIVNLRGLQEPGVAEAKAAVEALGMRYIEIPVSSAADLSRENATKLKSLLEGAEGSVMVHCKSGNRVGALFALKARWIDGKDLEESIEIGRATGLTGMEPAVRQIASADD